MKLIEKSGSSDQNRSEPQYSLFAERWATIALVEHSIHE